MPLVHGLSLLLCAFEAPATDKRPQAPRAPARVYTNDDLDRVRPFRDEWGAASVPAVAPRERESGEAVASPRGARDSGGPSTRDEAYWRRRATARWRNCDTVQHGRSWKQLFMERHLQEALEQ